MKRCTHRLLMAMGLACRLAHAEDRAVIDPTTILGNRELPKVLYIVPWKKPLPGELVGRPLVSVVDEALAPLEPDVFRRQLQYGAYAKVQAQAAQAAQAAEAAKATPPPSPPDAAPAPKPSP
jgi:hypothetical protein